MNPLETGCMTEVIHRKVCIEVMQDRLRMELFRGYVHKCESWNVYSPGLPH
jgi:hypothetical protein